MRYELSTDGTEVLDNQTGLIWQRAIANNLTHSQALEHAEREAKASGLPWRVPTIEELLSLVGRSQRNPASGFPDMPPNTPSQRFWSSSPYVGNSINAWYVNFSLGFVNNYYRNGLSAVRLVRGG
jgi:hypothetical protein